LHSALGGSVMEVAELCANGAETVEGGGLPARLGRDDEVVARCLDEAFEHRDGRVDLTAFDPCHRRG